jgi:hypothetical protein
VKTVSLSGFPAGYENVCQQMLWNGIRAIEERPEWGETALKQMKGYRGVYGVVSAEGPEAKELDEKIMAGVTDATGAMHHQVVSVLCYIAQNGKENWLKWVEENQPERIFEWDGTEASCPKADE